LYKSLPDTLWVARKKLWWFILVLAVVVWDKAEWPVID